MFWLLFLLPRFLILCLVRFFWIFFITPLRHRTLNSFFNFHARIRMVMEVDDVFAELGWNDWAGILLRPVSEATGDRGRPRETTGDHGWPRETTGGRQRATTGETNWFRRPELDGHGKIYMYIYSTLAAWLFRGTNKNAKSKEQKSFNEVENKSTNSKKWKIKAKQIVKNWKRKKREEQNKN